MVDENKLHREKDRGVQADALLANELLNESFQKLEAEYLKAWGATHPHQVDAREHYWRAIQILGDVRNHLSIVAKNGRMAQRQLDDLAQKFMNRAA